MEQLINRIDAFKFGFVPRIRSVAASLYVRDPNTEVYNGDQSPELPLRFSSATVQDVDGSIHGRSLEKKFTTP